MAEYAKRNTARPCPFCGKKPNIDVISSGHDNGKFNAFYRLRCPVCGIEFIKESEFVLNNGIPRLTKDGYGELLQLWNRRVDDEKIF